MACERYQEQFTDFLEGTLPEQSWRELELHLQQCEKCAAAIKAFRQTVSALRSLTLVEPPRTLARAIGERIAQEAAALTPAPPGVQLKPARRSFPWSATGALAAACLVIAAVAIYSLRQPSGPVVTRPAPTGPGTEGTQPLPPAGETIAPAANPAQPATSSATGPASAGPEPRAGGAVSAPSASRGARGGSRQPSTSAPPAPNAPSPATSPPAAPVGAPGGPPGAAGAAGPAGPAGPQASALPAAVKTEVAPGGSRAFGDGAATRGSAGPISMEIKVDPPGARRVGDWGPLSISLTAGGDVPQVSVRVIGDSALQVQGGSQVYSGSLQARRPRHITAQVRAQQPGSHRLKVVLASDIPIANTSVDVYLRGYAGPAAPDTTRRCFRSAPLGEAARAVGQDCGLTVEVEEALAGRRVSADFSGGVAGGRALRSLASMVGGKLVSAGDGYRIVAAE